MNGKWVPGMGWYKAWSGVSSGAWSLSLVSNWILGLLVGCRGMWQGAVALHLSVTSNLVIYACTCLRLHLLLLLQLAILVTELEEC